MTLRCFGTIEAKENEFMNKNRVKYLNKNKLQIKKKLIATKLSNTILKKLLRIFITKRFKNVALNAAHVC